MKKLCLYVSSERSPSYRFRAKDLPSDSGYIHIRISEWFEVPFYGRTNNYSFYSRITGKIKLLLINMDLNDENHNTYVRVV